MFLIVLLSICLNIHIYTESPLVNDAFEKLNPKDYYISDNYIRYILHQIKCAAFKHELNELNILKQLNEKITQQIKYYENNITKKRDSSELKKAIGFSLAGFACAALSYFIYQKWHKGSNDSYNKVCEDLSKINVKITCNTSYDSYNNIITTTFESSSLYHLSPKQRIYVNTCWNQLISDYKTKGNAIIGETCGVAGSLFSFIMGYFYLDRWLHPEFKKCYEQSCLIKKKIEEEIISISKKYPTYGCKQKY